MNEPDSHSANNKVDASKNAEVLDGRKNGIKQINSALGVGRAKHILIDSAIMLTFDTRKALESMNALH